MKEKTFSEIINKRVPQKYHYECENKDLYYTHPTFMIENLADYIDLISIISKNTDSADTGDTLIFRGIAKATYDLSPGLSRIDGRDDLEENLINDFITRRPDAFKGLSYFDTLAKMQHYGLPTRLLDFSTNPLVALYFACETLKSRDGRVLCHNTFLQNDSSKYVNAICNSVFCKSFDCSYFVEEYFINDSMPLIKYLNEAYLFNETTVIRPKYWNQRIANQEGVFMVFPNDLVDRYWGVYNHMNELGLEKAIKSYCFGQADKSIIEQIIFKEPVNDYVGLKKPYLTHSYWKSIYDSYSKDDDNILKAITKRFRLSSSLKPVENDIITNNFCSILIKGSKKRRILKELSYLGIGVDYIYPELEYTAKEIKSRYEQKRQG